MVTRGDAQPADSTRAVRAIRGAISVEVDEPEAVREATREMLTTIVERNDIRPEDLISAMFTVTTDLTSAFPARAACELGWTDVPLLCALEIPVPGALARCIRVMVHVTSERPRSAIEHVYLRRAVSLRPDLVATRPDAD